MSSIGGRLTVASLVVRDRGIKNYSSQHPSPLLQVHRHAGNRSSFYRAMQNWPRL
ncbi:UNVERIFIED_CONTAM: hypothetical protein FKN15_027589 [Acipenser sinensis]